MVVQHNMTAINANRYFGMNNTKLSKSLEKLSSGYAINRAGDNAAGLAVSEKMRSQIAGINQGVKNAQDGISMVQTYEGALTETDSILQRMKTLATQSANGTYQDDVDREAIQLEFNQLNDELDQIADTDFNGVVALNGGQMADGTKAVDGKFDYANNTRGAKQLGAADINKIDYQLFDDSDASKGVTKADTVWNALNSDWQRNDATKSDGPDSIDISLKYDESANAWTVTSASDGANKGAITVGKTDNGGFSLTAGGVKFANVVLDGTSLKNGDTITLTLNNPVAKIAAPTNGGVADVDKSDLTQGTASTALKVSDANFTVAIDGTNVTDATMTSAIDKLFNQLDGATVTAKYADDTATAKGDMTIVLKDGTEIKGATDGSFTLKDGTQFFATMADGSIKISTANAAGTAADKDLVTIGMTAATKVAGNTTGTMTGKIAIDFNSYDTAETPSVAVKEPDDGAVSKSNSNNAATAPLTYTDHVVLQAGARTKDSIDFTFKYNSNGLGDLKANLNCSSREDGLGTKKLSLLTQEGANAAIDKIDNAINKVSMVRGSFGAVQNRLEHKIDNLNTTSENLTSAESRIRDTNMAEEMMNFTKNQILSQASQSMLAQANQLPQGVLSLLQ